MTRRTLDVADVRHIATGAMFVSCALDHETGVRHRDELVRLMEERGTGPVLVSVDELEPDDLAAAVGFVNNGLPISEMIPVGDEFVIAVELPRPRTLAMQNTPEFGRFVAGIRRHFNATGALDA